MPLLPIIVLPIIVGPLLLAKIIKQRREAANALEQERKKQAETSARQARAKATARERRIKAKHFIEAHGLMITPERMMTLARSGDEAVMGIMEAESGSAGELQEARERIRRLEREGEGGCVADRCD